MSADDNAYIQVKDLHFYRGDRAIFQGLNLQIARGKITAIMGPSGTGKTTLLRLIGRQLQPHQGDIYIAGQHLAALSHSQLYALRRQVSMLFQSGALFTHLSVFENIAFPLREHTTLSAESIRDLVLLKLEAVGLRGAHDLMPSELSGGMARRVALARAIALDPEIIMYDEPFTGQDPISMGVLVKLIKSLNEAMGLTSIIVSHDVAEVCSIADYAYIIANGVVVGEGTPEALAEDHLPRIQQFMHGEPDGPVPFHYPANALVDDLHLQGEE